MKDNFPKIDRIYDMRNAGELLRIALELEEICERSYEQSEFRNCLNKFTNLYKKSSDVVVSEYHKRFAEEMKNDRRSS